MGADQPPEDRGRVARGLRATSGGTRERARSLTPVLTQRTRTPADPGGTLWTRDCAFS
jgi:hypothetical protein